ncbi:MAG: hypothetical protein R3E39_14005 [Anaerolineae bacterium]
MTHYDTGMDNPPKWTRAKNQDSGDKHHRMIFKILPITRWRWQNVTKGASSITRFGTNQANEEWGKGPVNPEAYTDLLCRTYRALKKVDPKIVVISGPLSPTVSLTDYNLNDFIFLQRM